MVYFFTALNILIQIYVVLVIASAILSYILPPYDRIRVTIDRLVDPLLIPIRKMLPTVGLFDFSPYKAKLRVHVPDKSGPEGVDPGRTGCYFVL